MASQIENGASSESFQNWQSSDVIEEQKADHLLPS